MRLVVDANVILSAMLKDGLTRRLVLDNRLSLYAPRFLLDELKKYYPEFLRRSGINSPDFQKLFSIILLRVVFVSSDELCLYLSAARGLTTDEKDIVYVASALVVGCDLWSNDRHLRQPRVKCWNTVDLAKELGYLVNSG